MNMCRRLLSVARTCKKAIRKTILRCPFLKRNKKRGDETSAEEEVVDSREAVENQINPSSTSLTTLMVHNGIVPTTADNNADVVCEEKLKNRKRTTQNKEKPGVNPSLALKSEKEPKKTEKVKSRDAKNPAKSMPLTLPKHTSNSTTETCKGQEKKTVALAEEPVIDSREAIEIRSNPSATLKTVSIGHCEVVQTSAVVCEEKPKEGKRAKRTRRNKGKSGEDKLLPVVMMPEKKPDKVAKKAEKSEEIIIHDTETTVKSVSLTPTKIKSNSATKRRCNEAETCKGQEEKKAKSVVRKQCKSKLDSLLPTDGISQKTENVLNANKARRITKTAVDSSTLPPSSVTKNENETPKSREIVMGAKQRRIAVEVSSNYERIDETSRKQPRVISDDDVSRAKEQRTVVCKKTTETSITTQLKRKNIDRNCNGKSTDTSNGSGNKQSAIAKRNSADGDNKTAVKRKTVNSKQESNKKVELSKAEAAVRETDVVMTYAGVAKKRSQNMNEELNIKATSILNKISRRNVEKLTEKFKDLPINTVQCLDSITTIVFEKAIGKQSYAPLYAALCSAMQSVLVTCPESKRTVTFKASILQKCQDVFEADKFYRTVTAANELAEINSCSIPEKKIELRLAYEKKEKDMSKRSMGNCRFIGELFKERLVSSNIILYCITNLIDQRSDQPLECLCNLLMIVGEEFERCTSLKGTFKKLNALMSDKSVSARIKSMIRDVVDLRRNKWSRDVKTQKT